MKYKVRGVLTDLKKSCTISIDERANDANAVEGAMRVAISTMRMYARCGCMSDAHAVFDSIQEPSLVSWNALLTGYAVNGDGRAALSVYSQMKAGCMKADSATYVAALKACTRLAESGEREQGLQRGREIHAEVGYCMDRYVTSSLINMYAKCGELAEARRMFESADAPDVVSWTALILGYAVNGEAHAALDLFSKVKAGLRLTPNPITLVAALKACVCLAASGEKMYALERGREIHSEFGPCMDSYTACTLMDLYFKCGNVSDARNIFDSLLKPDRACWTALVLGYAENGEGHAALELFCKMRATSAFELDSMAAVAGIRACTFLAVNGAKAYGLEQGREIHREIGHSLRNRYVQNTLIDMYAKCSSMREAQRVFDSIKRPCLVSWNALLLGYADNGKGQDALDIFSSTRSTAGYIPDAVTYIAVLKACALTGALAFGRKLHEDIDEFSPHLVTCLVDFYAKCGDMVQACKVLETHARARDMTAWNALLSGHAVFGDAAAVFAILEALRAAELRPDAVTILSALVCCSHAGLVKQARECLEQAQSQDGITPDVRHYTCMVDVLGRANQLNEAVEVIESMPCSPNSVTWLALLGACHKWKNVEVGSRAFSLLVGMDSRNAPAYVLMARIYAACGMWDAEARVLDMRRAAASV